MGGYTYGDKFEKLYIIWKRVEFVTIEILFEYYFCVRGKGCNFRDIFPESSLRKMENFSRGEVL